LLHAYLVVPYTFYLKRNTASLIQNVISETEYFTHYCLLPLLNVIANFIIMFVLLLLLAKTSLLLLAMMLGILLPIFLLFQRFGGKLSKWGEILSKTHNEMIRIINHSLGGVKETRIIGCELYFEQQMAQEAQKHSRAATFYLGTENLATYFN
jgi:ABC-type multidrug transport system fused ATPase/permease subunit